jgi:hypothetical protein
MWGRERVTGDHGDHPLGLVAVGQDGRRQALGVLEAAAAPELIHRRLDQVFSRCLRHHHIRPWIGTMGRFNQSKALLTARAGDESQDQQEPEDTLHPHVSRGSATGAVHDNIQLDSQSES